MQDETIKLLISKIQNGLPEIKIRSISTLYTKITIGIIQSKQLPLFINLPGVLLQWINDNRARSQPLFKVLTILSNFSKTTEGLVLLQQYQALEFFQMYRQYLLDQQPRHDQYTNLLQSLIKILIPLSSDKEEEEKIQSKNIEQAQQKQKIDKKQRKQKGESVKNKEIIKGAIKMSWIVIRQPLGKKQQDELYSLMMEIRHSKKQLQLQWLKRIQQLIRYWGYKSFRFRVELINQLTEQFPKSNFKWLIISIITVIIRGIGQVSQQYSLDELQMLKFSNPQQILQSQTQKVTLTLKKQLFDSIYSHLLIDQLIKYSGSVKESDLQQVLTQINYRYTPYYFIYGLQKITKNEQSIINLQTLNQSIEYYCQYYEGFPDQIAKILSESHQSLKLSSDKFPILKNCLSKVKKNKSLSYIQGYGQNWQLGLNLHLVAQIMNNLQKGIEAVQISNSPHYISIYLNAILTLAIAVEKQDPLMSYYPKAVHLVSILAGNSLLSQEVYKQIRQLVGSDSTIKYGSKNYNKTQLALMIFSEENMYATMFSASFANQTSLEYWLEITNSIVLKNKSFCELDTYFCIVYCLGYHKNQNIKNISKKLLDSLTKKGKKDVYYCRLFSKSQEQRSKVAKELFDQNSEAIIAHLENKAPRQAASNKRPLKISQQSMQNYISIILNKSLSDQIRINASKQLIQSLQRVELNPVLSEVLSCFSQRIAISLSQPLGALPLYIYSFFIQINGILNQILQQKYHLQIQATINLLQIKLPARAVQILLQNLYSSIFQNPFSKDKQIHYIALLYPHIKYQQLKIGGEMPITHTNIDKDQKPSKVLKSPLDETEYLPQFEKFIQLHIYKILNNQKFKLDQFFVSLVQKQIGNVLHATKGIASLHYLSFSLSFLKMKKIAFPQNMEDYSTPLLSSLLSKDQNPHNCQPLAKIISVIGVKRSRQILSLLSSTPQGIWKYHILLHLQSIEDSKFDIIVKGLLGMSNGLEAILILRLVLRQCKQSKISIFSQTMILNSCIKFARQGEDVLLRKTAICVLTELYKTPNMICEGSQDIFGSISSILLEDCLTISEINLFLNLIKNIINKDSQIIDQTHIAKLLLEKIVAVLSQKQLPVLTITILFEIINLVTINNRELLTKYDLIDLALNYFTKSIEKNQINSLRMKSMATTLDYIYLQIEFDQNLPKYILSSTSLLKKIVDFLKIEYSQIVKPLMQAIGRLILRISTNQEDLFVYKLNQIVKNELKSLFGILSLNINNSGNNYLKMMGWLMVIWLRNREDLEPMIGQEYSQLVLNSSNPELIKQALPFSLQAKKMLVNSKYLLDLLKENHTILDNRIVKQNKDKKRKVKIYQLDIQETHTLQSFFSLLSALFYWGDSFQQVQIKEPEAIKKIIVFIEKFYSCGLWQENIVKQYLKVVTNMTVGSPLGSSCSLRLTENGIMIEDVVNTVMKCDHFDGPGKLALKLLSVLVNFQSIRSLVLRARVIEELTSKLIKGQQRGDISIETMMDIIELFLSFSSYKDSNTRLFNDKKVLQILIRILKMGKFSLLQQKIIILMGNLACFKSNKPTFMSNREIHKVILGLLEDKDISYHEYLINLLYNIVYKNSAALKLYRRPQVVLLIKNVSENCHNEVRKGLLEALVSQETF